MLQEVNNVSLFIFTRCTSYFTTKTRAHLLFTCMQLQPHPFMFRAVPHFSPFREIAIVQAQGSVAAIYGLKCGTARNMKGWGCIHYGGTNHGAIPSLHNITDQKYPCTCITCERRTANRACLSWAYAVSIAFRTIVVSFMLYVCTLRRASLML